MKADRENKLRAQLAATEAQLITLLRDSLAHTAAHGDMLFFNSRYRPANVSAHWVSPRSETIVTLATESLALRDQLSLPAEGSPGQLYMMACSEAADTGNDHRRGPRQLATWLISALGPG